MDLEVSYFLRLNSVERQERVRNFHKWLSCAQNLEELILGKTTIREGLKEEEFTDFLEVLTLNLVAPKELHLYSFCTTKRSLVRLLT